MPHTSAPLTQAQQHSAVLARTDHRPTGHPPVVDAGSLRICIVTDAWYPQVNGVVRTLTALKRELRSRGHKVLILSPKLFKTLPCPTYPEIRLSYNIPFRLKAILKKWQPDAIHIATEGPLGWATRRYCIQSHLPFTTAYHTAFPEYISARSHLPADWFYPLFRRFHAPSRGILVATETVRENLSRKAFSRTIPWSRGVDTSIFHPQQHRAFDFAGPVQLYVGRVAVEKNLEAFLKLDTPGTKVIVGDGPARFDLAAKYPDARFLGPLFGSDLAAAYASADVFVFPSLTDTFGLVMIEALACGTPVAAYPVQGPIDVLGHDGRGTRGEGVHQIAAIDTDLKVAIEQAATLKRAHCTRYAEHFSWRAATDQFINALHPTDDGSPASTLPAGL